MRLFEGSHGYANGEQRRDFIHVDDVVRANLFFWERPDGGVYNVGFAVHDDNITTRGHHGSFVRTLGFGAKADIEAVKLP